MDPEFWHERWAQQQIGFHQQDINPYLVHYWRRLTLPPSARVLVPCCGKSNDMLWLCEQGHSVVGLELSRLAVEAFFNDNALKALVQDRGGFSCWECDELQIMCGDLFDLDQRDIGTVDAVYDRAALIAMPPAIRPAYVEQLFLLTGRALPQLLVTMEYDPDEMDGPPFSVAEDEVHELYQERYHIELLERRSIIETEPRFQERGLTRLSETAYRLQPR